MVKVEKKIKKVNGGITIFTLANHAFEGKNYDTECHVYHQIYKTKTQLRLRKFLIIFSL